ncbi:FtsX-like permease family protein [Usitatibacter palustris]|uniref:ABC3 transporter permease C-terminal domain-containing protein n=1 Tax=Usitatibacter palustris TaxID=2732487 RepID=A0A6M4HBH0_9PROT|nr:ABC transporter permease [Usitatibacter palustris]QJR15317.1 hypothetical protein DSM104440_02136 [Usitatibacter palustris]
MNAGVASQLLRGFAAGNRARIALSVAAIALGVALGTAVDTLHSSAIAEIEGAARALGGTADLNVRGPRLGFDESLYPALAKRAEVQVANPIVEVEAKLAGQAETVRVMGIDIFKASRMQPAFLARQGAATASEAVDYLDKRNAWMTPAAFVRAKAKVGQPFKVRAGSRDVELIAAGTLPQLADGGAAIVMDIAAAQDLFDLGGKLSRVELRLKRGVDVASFHAALLASLPPGVTATTPASLPGRLASLTRAYRVNLAALSLVSLLTGLFLVFSALALQAARRRQEFALLRALGVTRRGLLGLLAIEGLVVGVAGSVLGVLLGLVSSRVLLETFGSDLGAGYFRGIDSTFAPDPIALVAIAIAGVAVAMTGALVVARAVARLDVATALRDRTLDLPVAARHALRWAAAFGVAGALLLTLPAIGGLPLGGYAAIALWLAAAVLVVDPVCRALIARLRPSDPPIVSLALAQVRHLPGHLSAAVAGIVVSTALCAAMAVMVHSFRVSLEQWLSGVIGADLYVRSSPQGDTGFFTFAEQQRVAALPGIATLEALRYDRLVIDSDLSAVTLLARPVDARSLAGFQASPAKRPEGSAIPVWISEAAIDLHGWKTDSTITLPIAGRRVPVLVAGRFRDYARTWGAVLMDVEDYRRLSGDDRANDMALRLAPGHPAATAIAAIRQALPASELVIDEASEIHRRSLAAFDRTFAATYALEAVAIFIALAGVTSSFAALAWSRRREFGVLRHLGLTRREVLRLLALEGAAAGALGAGLGLAAGSAISLVLIGVVNRQSFHWDLELHWPLTGLAILAAAVVLLCALGARWSARAAVRADAVLAVKDDA